VILATTGIEPQRVASVAGLQNFIRTTAGAFGAALTSTYWSNQITQHRADLVPHIAPGSPAYDAWSNAAGSLGFHSDQALALIDRTVQSQAVMLATDQYFMMASVLLLAVVAIIWTAKPIRMDAPLDPALGRIAPPARDLALQRAKGIARSLGRAGLDQISDGLGLRQVELVVEEGALTEFTGPCLACAEL
jgi:hypothetical protein